MAATRLARSSAGPRADDPTDVTPRGWRQILVRTWKASGDDQAPLLAAGVAFFGFLAVVPTLIAAILVYGLAFNPADITRQLSSLQGVIPAAAIEGVIQPQMEQVTSTSSGGLTFGLVIALGTALWSASGAVGNLISAISVAYGTHDSESRRSFVAKRAMALTMTFGAIVTFVVMVALLAVVPAVLDLDGALGVLVDAARWVLLVAVFLVGLGVLYRYSPQRARPRIVWISPGAVAATAIWLVASAGFSLYTTLGGYGSSYGALAGVVVLMMWLYLTCYAALLGAELNAEVERWARTPGARTRARAGGTPGAARAQRAAEPSV